MLSAPLHLTPLLAQITWTIRLMAVAFVVISVFMMLVILIQKPKGGGLSGAFGGAGGSDTSFVGAKVGDFLTILTVGCFLSFLLLGMGLTWAINPIENSAAAAESTAAAGMSEIPDDASTQDDADGADDASTLDSETPAAPEAQAAEDNAATPEADQDTPAK